MANRTLIGVIHEGSGEWRFPSCHLLVTGDIDAEAAMATVQGALDAWCEANPGRLDRFGDAGGDLTPQEVAGIVAGALGDGCAVAVIDTPVRCVFV